MWALPSKGAILGATSPTTARELAPLGNLGVVLAGSASDRIRALAADYASVADPELRASLRAQLLALTEKLDLSRVALVIERVETARFQADPVLRGAIRAHIDLAFRSPSEPAELMEVATRGICRVAWHPEFDAIPVGVALALPINQVPRERAEMFADDTSVMGAPIVVLFALATNPPRLGAAAALLTAIIDDCAQLDPTPRLLAFTPLTGLRAELIRLVDDDEAWEACGGGDEVRAQVRDALAIDSLESPLQEPLRSWLVEAAETFADSNTFAAGEFHRNRGATVIGICEGADPNDPAAMWIRALFDYGEPQKKRRHRPKTVPPI